MALKIYKPGQGYWTRMVSGIGGGVLVAAGALWLWGLFDNIYARAIAALVVIAVFGLLLFYLVALRHNTSDFLIATEGEMKKVNWPTRREVFGSTWVVILCTFLLVLILFASDTLFAWFFQTIHVLETGT
jgi:preprotein translocase SecE subunit